MLMMLDTTAKQNPHMIVTKRSNIYILLCPSSLFLSPILHSSLSILTGTIVKVLGCNSTCQVSSPAGNSNESLCDYRCEIRSSAHWEPAPPPLVVVQHSSLLLLHRSITEGTKRSKEKDIFIRPRRQKCGARTNSFFKSLNFSNIS